MTAETYNNMMVRIYVIFPIWSQSAIITPKIPVDVIFKCSQLVTFLH